MLHCRWTALSSALTLTSVWCSAHHYAAKLKYSRPIKTTMAALSCVVNYCFKSNVKQALLHYDLIKIDVLTTVIWIKHIKLQCYADLPIFSINKASFLIQWILIPWTKLECHQGGQHFFTADWCYLGIPNSTAFSFKHCLAYFQDRVSTNGISTIRPYTESRIRGGLFSSELLGPCEASWIINSALHKDM